MTSIAWAIVLSIIIMLPEDKGLKIDHPSFVAFMFIISSVTLMLCTIRDLTR